MSFVLKVTMTLCPLWNMLVFRKVEGSTKKKFQFFTFEIEVEDTSICLVSSGSIYEQPMRIQY